MPTFFVLLLCLFWHGALTTSSRFKLAGPPQRTRRYINLAACCVTRVTTRTVQYLLVKKQTNMGRATTIAAAAVWLLVLALPTLAFGFGPSIFTVTHHVPKSAPVVPHRPRQHTRLSAQQQRPTDEELEEEARLKVLESRRYQIRSMLKSAESLRTFRINNGYVPEIDPSTGKPIKSDGKSALTLTAFVVAFGAVVLRVGGRAALVSGLGLNFAQDNPDLKDSIDVVLSGAADMSLPVEAALFILGWTFVKVFCFDAGGIVLAFSSGVLFGGVLQGAVMSAFAATVGSSAAFFLAKIDSPVRKKALELLDEYPSLRGIEKVVAEDGLKAILTLRLAPVLPIPIGLYNYVYGVTSVPFLDFAGGIFLGSLKPYLLDAYLGVFSMSIVDGSINESGGLQDVILLVALGVSVLIGVFASQLAGETFESITEEIEKEQKEKAEEEGAPVDDGITREVMGMKIPQWLVGFQLRLQEADERIDEFIKIEHQAGVWNYTKKDGGPPRDLDPAYYADSPEILNKDKGFDFSGSICDGLVLSPALFKSYLKYADPLWTEENLKEEAEELSKLKAERENVVSATPISAERNESGLNEEELVRLAAFASAASLSIEGETKEGEVKQPTNIAGQKEILLDLLQQMRTVTEARLREVESELQ